MNPTPLVKRLRSAPRYAYWHATARLLSNQKSGAKAAKLGHAMRELGRWPEAETAYLNALGDGPPPTDREPSRFEAACYNGLSVAQLKLGKHATAYASAVTACSSDDIPPSHALQLLNASKAVDNKIGLIKAARILRRTGDSRPRLLFDLAEAYEAVGHWEQAVEVLESLTRSNPDIARWHGALARVYTLMARWQGTFVGDVEKEHAGLEFKPINVSGNGRSVESCRKAAVAAWEKAVALNDRRVSWRSGLAEARIMAGDVDGGIADYEQALGHAKETDGIWAFSVKHRWQYKVEQAFAHKGEPRHHDPHFECSVTRPDHAEAARPGSVTGMFIAQITYSGLHLSGFLTDHDVKELVISLDDVPIRRVKVDNASYLGNFVYSANRAALPAFPARSRLSIATADGRPLSVPGGGTQLVLTIPHGNGGAMEFARSGRTLDKKGGIPQSPEETRARQDRYLNTYEKVREFFESELDRSLFLLYGTLLGFHREGDFIKGDDDFDGGWVSNQSDPDKVKEETFDIVVELVKAGFWVSFNRRGRLFRAQLAGDVADDIHLDLRPIWFESGKVWLHNHCSFNATRDDFLPVATGRLRDVEVSVPADTEKFLRSHYGPGWKTPDPGFTYYLSKIDPAILEHLGKALITPSEYRALADRVEKETSGVTGAGRFISVGSQDFYPLDQFIG